MDPGLESTGNSTHTQITCCALKDSVKKQLITAAKGFCMGTADVIPGVSGGTMAFILGIYTQLINGIRSFDRAWLQALVNMDTGTILGRPHFPFLLPLFTGIVAALMFFTRVVPLPQLLLDYPEQIYGMFFGLITGSIVVLFRELEQVDRGTVLALLAGFIFGMVVFNLVPVQTPDAGWFIFIAGILAICAMLLPGISGSFILLILNKYTYVFNAIGYLEFRVIIPFFLGAATGLVAFSRVLSWLLNRYYQKTVQVILGLLASSLWVIWPFQERIYESVGDKGRLVASTPYLPAQTSPAVVTAVLLMIAGIAVVFMIEHMAKQREKTAD